MRTAAACNHCRSKQEEDRIIAAEVDTLKQRLSDPKLDKTRGREYMVRVIYCEMLGHDASFALIPALQLASDPNLLTKKVRRTGFAAEVSHLCDSSAGPLPPIDCLLYAACCRLLSCLCARGTMYG